MKMRSLQSYILEGKKFVVFVMCGIPGSGKSTWAKEKYPDLTIVSRDEVRAKLGYTKNSDEKAVLTAGQEKEVTTEEYSQIAKLAKKRQSFIVDDTNTTPKYRKNLISTLKGYGAYVIGVNITTPLEICINRRRGQIPASVMEQLFRKALPLRKEDVDELLEVKGY